MKLIKVERVLSAAALARRPARRDRRRSCDRRGSRGARVSSVVARDDSVTTLGGPIGSSSPSRESNRATRASRSSRAGRMEVVPSDRRDRIAIEDEVRDRLPGARRAARESMVVAPRDVKRANDFLHAARPVLRSAGKIVAARRARVVAAPSVSSAELRASFVENFALAEMPAPDGIKHGTARDESTPRVRVESIQPITQSTGRLSTSSRITPSRLAVLAPMSSRARPPRSDRTWIGCKSSEDQGGPV